MAYCARLRVNARDECGLSGEKPRDREKHFVVARVIEPELPSMRVDQVELEAVHSKQVHSPHCRELTDASLWHQGWV